MKSHHFALSVCILALSSLGATYETENFRVTASSVKVAKAIAEGAEQARKKVALDWLGEELPQWATPCFVKVTIHRGRSRGLTSYTVGEGYNTDWEIELFGTLDELAESVVPHEVSHTVLASLFSHPLPRWADEGAAMLSESQAEQKRQRLFVTELIRSKKRTPLRYLLHLREYPRESADMRAIYLVGYSLSDYLVQSGGRKQYLQLLSRAEKFGWEHALRSIYGFESIESLERAWINWVSDGHPAIDPDQKRIWVKAEVLETVSSTDASDPS